MEVEIWKGIEDFEDYYEVSNLGRVRSLDKETQNRFGYYIKKGRILTTRLGGRKQENLIIVFKVDGIQYSKQIRRLVMEAFGTKPSGINENIILIDKNPLNNRIENLKWSTQSDIIINTIGEGNCNCYNQGINNSRFNKKISQYNLKGEYIQSYDSITIASQNTGIGRTSISSHLRGKSKTAGGFKWKYN